MMEKVHVIRFMSLLQKIYLIDKSNRKRMYYVKLLGSQNKNMQAKTQK